MGATIAFAGLLYRQEQQPTCVIQTECLDGTTENINLFEWQCKAVESCSCGCFEPRSLGTVTYLNTPTAIGLTVLILISTVISVSALMVIKDNFTKK